MSARSVRAFLHNETPSTLTQVHSDIPHGEWGAGRAPAKIEAWMTAPMGSESAGFLTGTEANVTYHFIPHSRHGNVPTLVALRILLFESGADNVHLILSLLESNTWF